MFKAWDILGLLCGAIGRELSGSKQWHNLSYNGARQTCMWR